MTLTQQRLIKKLEDAFTDCLQDIEQEMDRVQTELEDAELMIENLQEQLRDM